MHRLLILASMVFGGGSLVLLLFFLAAGSLELVPLGLSRRGALTLDAGLCLLFFLQHSGMIRGGFRRRLGGVLPGPWHAALYGAASGLALLALLVLWQRSGPVVWELDGPGHLALRLAFVAALLGGWWGVRALGSFDALGIYEAHAYARGVPPPAPVPFTVRGPYRWVRHPLYTLALVLLWAAPHMTLDRLLLSTMWTAWIVLATRLEERDLVARFGQPYRDYQRAVPMLLPWRRPRGG